MAGEAFDPDDKRLGQDADHAENGDAEIERGPLAERLRNLRWPAVAEPGLAERSWEAFQRRLAQVEQGATDGGAGDDAE
jgi:hypothetical protein